MEKLRFVSDTERWMDMRDVRNRIVHEYLPDDLEQLYAEIRGPFFCRGSGHWGTITGYAVVSCAFDAEPDFLDLSALLLALLFPRKSGKIPLMAISRVDSKKRVRIPKAEPGDVFDIQEENEDRYVLVRIRRPENVPGKTREACMKAIAESPLSPEMSWEELRGMTREP